MHRKPSHLSLFALLLPILVISCARQDGKPVTPASKPPVPVVLATAELRTVPVEVQSFGSCEAIAQVVVKSRIGGQLQQVHFREGDDVTAGQLLFTLDPQPFEVALRQADAVLARDRAQQQHARQRAERYRQLLEQGFISQQEFDHAQSEATALEALLRVDQANLDGARLQLDYCRIKAPMAGRTGSLLADPGTLVKASEGDGLVMIQQLAPIRVAFTVPETQLATVRAATGRRPLVRARGEDGTLLDSGTLTFIDNSVDPTTGTIRLKAEFPNVERRLWPGGFVRVELVLGERAGVVTVPTVAVQTGQKGPFVFVVDQQGTAQVRPVTVGIAWNGLTVIESGIASGEQVVIDGQMRLSPGARVATGEKKGTGDKKNGEKRAS